MLFSDFFIKLPQYSVRIVLAFQAPPVFPLSHMKTMFLYFFIFFHDSLSFAEVFETKKWKINNRFQRSENCIKLYTMIISYGRAERLGGPGSRILGKTIKKILIYFPSLESDDK